MATPVTSTAWVVSFKVDSVTEQRTFSITLANTVPRSVVLGLVTELRLLGYVNVDMVLSVVLP